MQRIDARLYLITDDHGRSADELERIVTAAIDGGTTMVQYREKSADSDMAETHVKHLSTVCRRAATPLLVNGSLLNTPGVLDCIDGVHLQAATIGLLSELKRSKLICGYSAHSADEANDAFRLGADFVTISPIFPTRSHPESPAVGLQTLQECARQCHGHPVIALGGLCAENARWAIEAGAKGVAVISAIMDAANPGSAARMLREAVDSASPQQKRTS